MVRVADVVKVMETFAPISYQESYDNSGLIIGTNDTEVKGVLVCLDVTEDVLDEAIELGANMIISHHPIVFSGVKRFNGNGYVQRIVQKSIKNDLILYASHTNADSVLGGVNSKLAEIINLQDCKVLSPIKNDFFKLVTFIPTDHFSKVSNAVFDAGAGSIGNYDKCGFATDGQGSFRAGEDAKPFVGSKSELHFENETRFETVFPKYLKGAVINSLLNSHPYEEVAYDLYELHNYNYKVGLGIVGDLKEPMTYSEFIEFVKDKLHISAIKCTKFLDKKINRVAVCGGSGAFLLNDAIGSGADIFISGDFKYHQFFDADNRIVIADVGHYESEKHVKSVFYELLTKKITNFAVYISRINTNPINII